MHVAENDAAVRHGGSTLRASAASIMRIASTYTASLSQALDRPQVDSKGAPGSSVTAFQIRDASRRRRERSKRIIKCALSQRKAKLEKGKRASVYRRKGEGI